MLTLFTEHPFVHPIFYAHPARFIRVTDEVLSVSFLIYFLIKLVSSLSPISLCVCKEMSSSLGLGILGMFALQLNPLLLILLASLSVLCPFLASSES